MARHLGASRTKIVFFDEAVAFGGSVVVLANLLQHIDRSRFAPMVVTSLDPQSIDQLFQPEDILAWFRPLLDYSHRIRWMTRHEHRSALMRRVFAYGFSVTAFFANLPAHLKLYYRIWRVRPDIIHLNNGREAMFASQMFRIPLLVHLHGFAPETLRGRHGQIASAKLFVSISKYITDQVVAVGVAPDRIVDVANPCPSYQGGSVSKGEWSSRFSLRGDALVFAHVGRLIRWKGQLEFLRAFVLVAKQVPEAYALIVGDDVEGFSSEYPRSLRDFAAENGIADRVIFAGHVTNILDLMSFADVVVHSSIDPEPFGLVITEAMTAGAAVIAARLGAPIELIEHGRTGLLVNPKDVGEFSAALLRLAQDRHLRETLAAAGQESARQRFSPDSFARQMESAYTRVLDAEVAQRVRE